MIDTGHFSVAFIDELLAHLSDASDEGLAGQVEGLCINSENYQALRLLQDRYREKIDCVYIDPPYNSNSSEILYKNTYKHSSWLSLMDDRLSLGRGFLKADGVQVVAIDENEQERLGSLLSESFPGYDLPALQ